MEKHDNGFDLTKHSTAPSVSGHLGYIWFNVVMKCKKNEETTYLISR